MVNDQPSLAEIAARYQTINTVVLGAGPAEQKILNANPKRWWVWFQYANGIIGQWNVYPGPAKGLNAASWDGNQAPHFAFRDCPSVVTGEWYGRIDGGMSILITECIYLGRD